jgi:hypothetical protein
MEKDYWRMGTEWIKFSRRKYFMLFERVGRVSGRMESILSRSWNEIIPRTQSV